MYTTDNYVAIHNADSLRLLPTLAGDSVDALVTDPPAGVEFMGKEWDTFRGDKRQPGDATFHKSGVGPFDRAKVRHGTSSGYGSRSARATFIGALAPIFGEALRVLKVGAYGLVWALPRTSHWTATASFAPNWPFKNELGRSGGVRFRRGVGN